MLAYAIQPENVLPEDAAVMADAGKCHFVVDLGLRHQAQPYVYLRHHCLACHQRHGGGEYIHF